MSLKRREGHLELDKLAAVIGVKFSSTTSYCVTAPDAFALDHVPGAGGAPIVSADCRSGASGIFRLVVPHRACWYQSPPIVHLSAFPPFRLSAFRIILCETRLPQL